MVAATASVIKARIASASRQPMALTTQTSGAAPSMLPSEPRPTTAPPAALIEAGGRVRAKMKKLPIITGAQPMPSSVMATWICQGVWAIAKTAAPPAPPSASSTDTASRGPQRSSAQPTGSCMAAKAIYQSPEDSARSAGPAPRSLWSVGDSTARKAR